MKVYSPNDIAKLLSVKESTLRKYSILLENAGYTFQRNNQNQRWYSDENVIALQKLVTLKNNGDMSLSNCANAVFMWLNGSDVTQTPTVICNDTERYESDITDLKEVIYKQNELIRELSKRLDQQQDKFSKQLLEQQDYIKNSIEKRDNDLLNAIEVKETKKDLATPEKKRLDRFNEMMAERKVNRILEKEAISLWSEKPEKERLKKVGWFREEENKEKREEFIRDYMDEHFEEYMKKEFGLE